MEPQNANNQNESDEAASSKNATANCESTPDELPPDNSDSIRDQMYNPFSASSDGTGSVVDVRDNLLVDRIYPFADNRPICECDTVRRMTTNPDVRYLLSLLPDMAEMNQTQKSVFRHRVIGLLNDTFSTESENKAPNY